MHRKYTPRQPRVTRTCQQCSVSFSITVARIRNGGGAYCSRACMLDGRHVTPERFWNRGVRRENGCLIWVGALNNKGYGQLRRAEGLVLTHRLAYAWAYGSIPDDLDVLHHCDTPPCYEPTHLFTGTNLDNMKDKVTKGRHPHGEQSTSAKLTDQQVRDIRTQWSAGGIRQADLAALYGVNRPAISKIVTRQRWQHID